MTQSPLELHLFIPESDLFWARQEVGTTFTSPRGSSVYLIFLLIVGLVFKRQSV